jgi:hypothetical protein
MCHQVDDSLQSLSHSGHCNHQDWFKGQYKASMPLRLCWLYHRRPTGQWIQSPEWIPPLFCTKITHPSSVLPHTIDSGNTSTAVSVTNLKSIAAATQVKVFRRLVLAMVAFSDCVCNSGAEKTRTQPVRWRFVANGALNEVLEYSSNNLVFGTWNMSCRRRIFWLSQIFDILKTQQAALKFLSFLAEKRGFWATACWDLKISKIGDGQKMRRAELHILHTKR